MAAGSLPEVGTRLAYAGYTGTVRFVGAVHGTSGIWLGVEWDDPKRGKHDGVKDGRRYFNCLVPCSGSFIRPTPAISYGTSFLKALVSKYVEMPHGSGTEKVVLGSSRGAIEVEAVNLDKIRGNLSNIEKLREVSLDDERIAVPGEPGEIRKMCPGIRGLDLSKNLLPSWDVVALIVSELPHLERLAVNWNRLQMPSRVEEFRRAFSNLKELQISATMTTWADVRTLVGYMPQLQLLETGYNRLRHLAVDEAASDLTTNTNLALINFDSNELTDWTATCEALRPFAGLRRLILSSNHLSMVDAIAESSSSPLRGLRHLALASNSLKTWNAVDRIPLWCPDLESLTLSGNPLFEDEGMAKHARQFTIAKIPSLTTLDAAQISPKERIDCELFYLSYISRHGPEDDDAKIAEHPRWKELCEKHGKPYIAPRAQDKHDTLGNRLIQIIAHRCTQTPQVSSGSDVVETVPLRVLPSMSTRAFRMKVAKSFKIPKSQHASIKMWLKLPDSAFSEIEPTQDTYDLGWLGFEDGSVVFVSVQQ